MTQSISGTAISTPHIIIAPISVCPGKKTTATSSLVFGSTDIGGENMPTVNEVIVVIRDGDILSLAKSV